MFNLSPIAKADVRQISSAIQDEQIGRLVSFKKVFTSCIIFLQIELDLMLYKRQWNATRNTNFASLPCDRNVKHFSKCLSGLRGL